MSSIYGNPDSVQQLSEQLRTAQSLGAEASDSVVREWDPVTGNKRTWLETVDGSGRVRIVRPQRPGPKVHYMFDD
jgi:hypothetical protein